MSDLMLPRRLPLEDRAPKGPASRPPAPHPPPLPSVPRNIVSNIFFTRRDTIAGYAIEIRRQRGNAPRARNDNNFCNDPLLKKLRANDARRAVQGRVPIRRP
jgi:hypothetical protein